MLIFWVVFSGWCGVTAVPPSGRWEILNFPSGSSQIRSKTRFLSLNLMVTITGGLWLGVNIWCGFRWEQDAAFFQMDFRGEDFSFSCTAHYPIRQEQFALFRQVDFAHKTQKNEWMDLNRGCLEGGFPSQLPGEFFSFFGSKTQQSKTSPKSAEQKTLGAHPRENNSI